jgi:hypothetical protein
VLLELRSWWTSSLRWRWSLPRTLAHAVEAPHSDCTARIDSSDAGRAAPDDTATAASRSTHGSGSTQVFTTSTAAAVVGVVTVIVVVAVGCTRPTEAAALCSHLEHEDVDADTCRTSVRSPAARAALPGTHPRKDEDEEAAARALAVAARALAAATFVAVRRFASFASITESSRAEKSARLRSSALHFLEWRVDLTREPSDDEELGRALDTDMDVEVNGCCLLSWLSGVLDPLTQLPPARD